MSADMGKTQDGISILGAVSKKQKWSFEFQRVVDPVRRRSDRVRRVVAQYGTPRSSRNGFIRRDHVKIEA